MDIDYSSRSISNQARSRLFSASHLSRRRDNGFESRNEKETKPDERMSITLGKNLCNVIK
ncbi:hypothetical protein ACTXT7_004266 [Hymenolepis weldensis]